MAVFEFFAGPEMARTIGLDVAPTEGRYVYSKAIGGRSTHVTLWKGAVKYSTDWRTPWSKRKAAAIAGNPKRAAKLRAGIKPLDRHTLEWIATNTVSPRDLPSASALLLQWLALDPDDKPVDPDGSRRGFLLWLFGHFANGEVHDYLLQHHPDGKDVISILGWDALYVGPDTTDGWAQPPHDPFPDPTVVIWHTFR